MSNDQIISMTYRKSIPAKPQARDSISQRRGREERLDTRRSNSDLKIIADIQCSNDRSASCLESLQEREYRIKKNNGNNTIDVVSKFRISDSSRLNSKCSKNGAQEVQKQSVRSGKKMSFSQNNHSKM